MKKFLKVFLPILLSIVILAGTAWYFLVYDRDFTRDLLLSAARFFEQQGSISISGWLYDVTFDNFGDNDEITLELVQQHLDNGNYTRAEAALYKAIRNGGGSQLYLTLSKLYLEQDKVLDAVAILDSATNQKIKDELNAARPDAPTCENPPGFYNQYIQVSFDAKDATLYVNTAGQYPSISKDLYTAPYLLQGGENVFCCVAVSEDGVVSPLAVFGYTVGGVIEQVVFNDTAMEQAIRNALGISSDKTVYSNALWEIEEFVVPESATNYADLRHFAFLKKLTIKNGVAGQFSVLSNLTNLESLTIVDTPVTQDELACIGQLNKLTQITLSGCNLATIAPLSGCTAVIDLDLSNNALRNLEAISKMPKLRTLNLHRNAITSLDALGLCLDLEKLDISNNSVTDLSGIFKLPRLAELNVAFNKLESLDGIHKMAAITALDLSNNSLTDVTAVSSCKTITALNISNNNLTEINSLVSLDTLVNLNFSNNQITAIPEFKKGCDLQTIDGSYNKISTLKPLEGIISLRTVLMDYNTEISLLKWLERCPYLIRVSVFGTKVTDASCLTDQEIIVNYNPVQ